MPHVDIIINGEKCPSVTEIVSLISKPYLDTWKRKVGFEEADRVMNEAAGLGRTLHSAVEDCLRGNPVQFCGQPNADKLFKVWHDWWLTSGYEVVHLEKLLISKKKKYGGTTDGILRRNSN